MENKQIIVFKKISLVDKYNFFEYISVMVDWWISIVEALESVESKITSVYFKERIKELIIYISSWDSFFKSMKKLPDIFDKSEVSIIEAWETTWMLAESLMKISDDLKKVHNLRNKIKWSLTYPIVIFFFLFLSLIIVLVYVIPEIQPLFDNIDVELPLSTTLLIWFSNFVISNIGLLFLFLASFVVLFIWYKNTPSWKRSIEEFILWFPLVWRVYRNYILSNIASSLWNLVWSWINIVKTLTLVWKSTNNSVYEELFEDIVVKISSGSQIVRAMEEVDPEKIYFPSDYLQMLSVWERTASLESITKKLNTQYTKEVDYSLENLTKWIEPIAILFASVFVLWFAYAILWAILKITQAV